MPGEAAAADAMCRPDVSLHPPKPRELLLCANAGAREGAGHVMRLAVLADAWKDAAAGPIAHRGRIDLRFAEVRMRAVTEASIGAGNIQGAVLVVDSYDDALRDWGARQRRAGLRVLVDDLGRSIPDGYDVVWNPNPFGGQHLYPTFRGAVIGGELTVPIRRLPPRTSMDLDLVGVFLGGGRVSPALLNRLKEMGRAGLPYRFVGGPWAPAGWGQWQVQDPWAALRVCGRIVTAGGTSLWECAASGQPVVAIAIAPNQQLGIEWAGRHGVPTWRFDDAASSPGPSAIAALLPQAIALPTLTNGAPAVVALLQELVACR